MDDIVTFWDSECWWINSSLNFVVPQGWDSGLNQVTEMFQLVQICFLCMWVLKCSDLCRGGTGLRLRKEQHGLNHWLFVVYTLCQAAGERVEVFLIRVNHSERSAAPAERSCYPDCLTCVTQCLGLKEAQWLLVPADVCLISAMISSIPSCTEYTHPLSHSTHTHTH